MQRICFINGSPRGKRSGSQYFLEEIRNMLDTNQFQTEEFSIVDCQNNQAAETAMAGIAAADCLVFVFPLYIDSVPSHLLDFLYRFEGRLKGNPAMPGAAMPPRVYAIVNNGFIEGTQNCNALRIMQHFAEAAGLQWRFGVGIGGGEFMKETRKKIPLQSKMKRNVYDALIKLKRDIETEEAAYERNLYVSPKMPKTFFMIGGQRHWITAARKNHVPKKQLYARPYQP